jgi:hypothetical protein
MGMKKFIVASVVVITLAAASAWAQQGIALWTFNGPADTTAGPYSPDYGSGQASGYHSGITFAGTVYSGPSGDNDPAIAALAPPFTSPAGTTPSYSWSANGWSVNDYWQFEVSTVGYTGIEIGWDQTSSNTGPGQFQLQYSTDDINWNLVGAAYAVPADAGANIWTASGSPEPLSTILSEPGTAWDNQSTLYFQLVDASTTSANGGTVAAAGTDRVDNFTVVGVPEPSTVVLVGAGLVGLLALRRRRS